MPNWLIEIPIELFSFLKFFISPKDVDKFLVLADNANGKLTISYDSFLRFKEVLQVINGIAFSDKTNYLYN